MKRRIIALLLALTAAFAITLQSGVTANAEESGSGYTINAKKDIPDIFSIN
ncbi:hypothetical protein [Proteiniclasticum sp. QWL-01]|uniref:hypothetical protein n=1 Tax=Proteiniclasticum sp. QWL-01 TaxID=3036945 RepID=UPI00240EC7C6|nr:hypothetical protein [Proteiniclasticum sp. QWL-01]WFF71716.1 hypothetical protein P6M73_10375 [Proteiniclasticum sp. QWL-01]